MSRKVVVALNALIDPEQVGGSESSALSIVANFRDASNTDIDMYVTSFPKYANRMRAIRGADDRVIEWPWREFTVVSSIPRRKWTADLRKLFYGRAAKKVFDKVSRGFHGLIEGRNLPSRSKIDALLDRYGVDVVHFTYPVKWPTRRPFIFEPHDIQQFHFPEFFHRDVLEWRRRTYSDGVRNAAFVVCGTWWTKRDIMKNFGVGASKVAVIPRSSIMARSTLSPAEEDAIAADAKLPERYMYYPAMTFPHKNHLRLFEAMARLRDRKGLHLNLICTGRLYKPFHPMLAEAIEKHALQPQVRFLGAVPDGLLSVCYKRARFIVFPSLLEGHSQSLLESLYHRKPIVAAKQSSVPETIGSAGYLFDALNVESIADALEKAWTDDDLMRRLAANAESNFDRNRWDRALVTLTACYKSAAGVTLSPEEKAHLDRALLEEKPEDA